MPILLPEDYESNLMDGFLHAFEELFGNQLSATRLGTLRDPSACPESWLPFMAELRGVEDLDTTVFGLAPRRELMRRASEINEVRTSFQAMRSFLRAWGYEYLRAFKTNANGRRIGVTIHAQKPAPTTAEQRGYLLEAIPKLLREDWTFEDGDLIIVAAALLTAEHKIVSDVWASRTTVVP